VAVAVAGGARSLGVATGSYSEGALLESGADRALADLGHLDAVLDALGLPR
jgi:phosphoglycolate phosphatase-like HAD superfamily hydrolase